MGNTSVMSNLELIVFFVPVVAIVLNFCLRVFFAKYSALRYVNGVNKLGIKAYMLRSQFGYLSILSFLVSPFFISFGWFWMVFGIVLIASFLLFLVEPVPKFQKPEAESDEFRYLVLRRKKQALVGIPILCLWGLSWV